MVNAQSVDFRSHARFLDQRQAPAGFTDRIYSAFRTGFKRQLWPHPRLYAPFGFWQQRRWLFRKDYDILVDGFSRSANTFASVALGLCAPGAVVLCHRHMPVYIIQALRDRKPVCLLIREPRAAIASWIIYSGWDFTTAIEDYISYYEPLVKYRDACVIAEFQQVTQQFPEVVMTLNRRYSLDYQIPSFDEAFKERVYEGVGEFGWARDPMTISLPSAERERLLVEVHRLLDGKRFAARLAHAQALYALFTR